MIGSLISFSHVTAELKLGDRISVTPLYSVGLVDVKATEEDRLKVFYKVENNNVFVECFINHFTFTEDKVGMQHIDGEGHIRLYVDEEHVATLFEGAFVVEGLPPGEHELNVVVVQNDRTPYDFTETWTVTI